MSTVAPPRTEAEAVTYGWQVFRAAQMTEWPLEHSVEIYRAFTRLSTELEMHGRLSDEWAALAAPRSRARHAEKALGYAADLVGLLEKYCTKGAAR